MRHPSTRPLVLLLALLIALTGAVPAAASGSDPTPKATRLIRSIRAELAPSRSRSATTPTSPRSRTARSPAPTCAPLPASSTTS